MVKLAANRHTAAKEKIILFRINIVEWPSQRSYIFRCRIDKSSGKNERYLSKQLYSQNI